MAKEKQRLRKKDLVENIFLLFSKEFDLQDDEDDIRNIRIPVEMVSAFLKEHYNLQYSSNNYIYSQLRSFEEENNIRLFSKESDRSGKTDFYLTICSSINSFNQKKYLYTAPKIKIANGLYERINHYTTEKGKKKLNLLLGAGVVIQHLARLIAEKGGGSDIEYNLYTHSVGVIDLFIRPGMNFENFNIFTRSGKVDIDNFTINDSFCDYYSEVEFDFIFQGTSRIFNNNLYVSSFEESKIKKDILKNGKGEKILVLLKKEFTDSEPESMHSYGRLSDYNFIIVPEKGNIRAVKKCDRLFDVYKNNLTPEIIHYNYSIYKNT